MVNEPHQNFMVIMMAHDGKVCLGNVKEGLRQVFDGLPKVRSHKDCQQFTITLRFNIIQTPPNIPIQNSQSRFGFELLKKIKISSSCDRFYKNKKKKKKKKKSHTKCIIIYNLCIMQNKKILPDYFNCVLSKYETV